MTAIVPGTDPADFDPGEPPEEAGETVPEACLDEPVGRPGLLNDISLTGCQVLFRAQPSDDEDLGIDTPVLVSFQVKADEDAFELAGRIRRLGRDSHRVELGIAFDVPAADAYQRIQDYLGPAL